MSLPTDHPDTPEDAMAYAHREAAKICGNYIEILRDERDALPKSETSILRHLANKEADRVNAIIALLKAGQS